MKNTMHEFKEGKLHSGSKEGPEVHSRAQAIAIGLSEERKVKEKTHHEGYEPHVEHEHSNHGHPGHHLRMKEEGHRVGSSHEQHEHEPMEHYKSPDMHGHPGSHAGMGTKSHGFGHGVSMRKGPMRMSGHPGAHRIGGKKK
jgi:Family of unknown function (DUF6496)